MGNLRIVNKSYYYQMKRKEIERALAEVEKWMLDNINHKDFIHKAQKRMSLLVDLEQTIEMLINVRQALPAHGKHEGSFSLGRYKTI
jgi:hypothetical protein